MGPQMSSGMGLTPISPPVKLPCITWWVYPLAWGAFITALGVFPDIQAPLSRKKVTADKVIFGAWDNTLYALNKADGKELWKWTGGLTRMHFSPAAVWPVAAEGKVFITDQDSLMTADNTTS